MGAPEDVAVLRAWIPRSVRSGCASAALRSAAERAALRCKEADLKDLRYVLYRSIDVLNAQWNAYFAKAAIRPGGTCAKGEEAQAEWSDEGIFGMFGEIRGTLACTVEADGDARIDWTTNDVPIWATLWREDEDISAAYATWANGRLNALREPR
jgi:hypothetical protein